MDDKDRERIRKQEILFSEYEHYQREMRRLLIETDKCDDKLIELKARILECDT